MKYALVAMLIWLFVQQTNAQSLGSIRLSLQSKTDPSVSYTVVLKRAADSAIVKIEYADAKQEFSLRQIPYGKYFLDIFFMNKRVGGKSVFDLAAGDLSLGEINVEESGTDMKEVKITAQKSIVERKSDKLIYNVENTQTSPADDALAVLQKAPGLTVDQNGDISMRGKNGVLVMINGKATNVQGEQLSTLLKGTMANQISKVEIISNPSSKYDANGNAGIVNIILKKDQRMGTNASITLSYGKGVYHKSNNSLNLNRRGKKLNVFASYNFVKNVGFNDLELYRKFYKNGVYQGSYHQHNYLRFPVSSHVPRVGFDYKPNEKTVIGMVVTGQTNQFRSTTNNKTTIEDANDLPQSYYTTTNRSNDFVYNGGINLNLKHTFDSTGREFSADADYVRFGKKTSQHFMTRYYDLQNVETLMPYILRGAVDGDLDIKACKADYTQPLKNGMKVECGVKSSLVKADNELSFYDESNGNPILDSNQSNHFIYQENINAAYATCSFEKKKTSFQFGLRTEQTVAKGKQIMNDKDFDRNYWQLFPTCFINHTFNTRHALGFSFSRRIQRPTYHQLNPFKYFIDASTYEEGNPYLVPQNTYLFELNHTFRQQYLLSLSSSITNKSITEVLIPAEGQSNVTIQTSKNVNKQYIHAISMTVPVKMAKWWNGSFDATAYTSHYVGELAAQQINSSTVSFNAKMMHTFTLPQRFTFQLDGFVQYREHYSFSSLGTFGAVNVSLQKSVFDKKATIKVSANDIFYTSRFRGSSDFVDYHESYYVQRDSRTVMLALSYRFGNNTLPANRRRAGGAEEEKQRAG